MARIKSNVSRLSSTDLLLTGRNIVSMMTGNPVYTALQGELPPLTAACDALSDSDQEVQFNGGKIAYGRKQNCVVEVRERINALVPKVQAASGGDSGKILSAGFEVRKEPEASKVPKAPQNFGSMPIRGEGKIKLRWAPQANVRYYHVECQQEGGEWTLAGTTSRCSIVLSGLEMAKLYTFRVIAYSAKGAGPNSGIIGVRAAV